MRQEVLAILAGRFPPELDLDQGRPGMAMGRIFVMGVLRLSLNCDDDRLPNLVNNPLTSRQILGYGGVAEGKRYPLQTLQDNVALRTPAMLDQVHPAVVTAGHEVIKKKAGRRSAITSRTRV